jgi:hypothetical protein
MRPPGESPSFYVLKTKKPRPVTRLLGFTREAPAGPGVLNRFDGHEFAVMWALYYKLNHAVCLREERVVFTTAYILSGVKTCTALTHDDVARASRLAAEELYAEAFGYGIAAVISTTASFLMRHGLTPT